MPGIAHAMEGALLMQRIYDFDFYEHDEDISIPPSSNILLVKAMVLLFTGTTPMAVQYGGSTCRFSTGTAGS